MKKLFQKPITYFMSALLLAGVIASCSSDDDNGGDPTPDVDRAVLMDSIAVANNLLETTEEGTAEGQYQVGAKADLQTAVNSAQDVHDSNTVTQTQVNNAVVSLSQAMNTYRGRIIQPVASEALIAHWTFDEGSGATVADASNNGLDGALMAGHATLGGGAPTWVVDRFGEEGKALNFDRGGHIEVPFNLALNPEEITIALWVKIDSIWPGNYMVSQNRWEGYKLNMQEANKIFFTTKVDHNGETPIYDRDNEAPELEIDTWYHIAVSFVNGEMTFYIQGEEAKKWDNTPGTLFQLQEPMDFVIGQEMPNAEVPADYEWVLSHFNGSMDEVRLYNTALSATQVQTLYNQEKPE